MKNETPKREQNRMLVVDDDATILDALRRFFGTRGWDVDVTTEREEAEALLVHRRYDLVLADVCLTTGGRDGLELLRVVREHRRGTRVVLLTGYGVEAISAVATELGASAVLEKPIPLPLLEAAIDRLRGVAHA